MAKRDIVFVNRFFHPDESATSMLLSDLAFHLASRGWNVRVVTSRQLYEDPQAGLPARERVRGVEVWRVRTSRGGRHSLAARIFDYLTFYCSAFLHLVLHLRPGAIVVAETDPPLISAPVALAARLRGAIHVNWIQDIFPDIAIALGVLRPNGPTGFLTRKLRNYSLGAATLNVAIGEVMHIRLAKRGIPSVVQPNWADGSAIRPLPAGENPLRRKLGLEGKFIVGHAGNLGRAHDYHTLLDSMRELRGDDSIHFVISGSGAGYAKLRSRAESEKLSNVSFLPYHPRAGLRELLTLADVHLVTLVRSLEGTIVPSKFYGIAAAGKPTIVIGAEDGEIGGIVSAAQCGETVARGDSLTLSQRLRALQADPAGREEMGRRARELFEREYDAPIALGRWEEILDSIAPVEEETGAPSGTPLHRGAIAFAGVLASAIFLVAAVVFTPLPGSRPDTAWIPSSAPASERSRAQMAARLADDPADWRNASAIASTALDMPVADRFALWRASHSLLRRLVRTWDASELPFVRAGLFHWGELGPRDRALLLEEAGAVLRDPEVFPRLYPVLWAFTQDIRFLRLHAPPSSDARRQLAALAVTNGRFADYRILRAEYARAKEKELGEMIRSAAPADQVLGALLAVPLDRPANPIIVESLRYLADNPPSGAGVDARALERFVEYVLRNRLQPVSGLVPLNAPELPAVTRARLAFAAGNFSRVAELDRDEASKAEEWGPFFAERAMEEARAGNLLEAKRLLGRVPTRSKSSLPALLAGEAIAEAVGDDFRLQVAREEIARTWGGTTIPPERWSGLCDLVICTDQASTEVYAAAPEIVTVNLRAARTDDVSPWVEIYLDDERIGEGAVAGSAPARIAIRRPGIHLISIRLANPVTRTRERRLVAVGGA